MNKLKYSNVSIPSSIGGVDGYHQHCYQKFTALSNKQRKALNELITNKNKEETKSVKKPITRSDVTSPKPVDSSGIFPELCLFCDRKTFHANGELRTLTSSSSEEVETNVKKYAAWLKDDIMLARIQAVKFSVKEVPYHRLCRSRYQRRAEVALDEELKEISSVDQLKTAWHESRETHAKAFQVVCNFIEKAILQDEEVHYIKDINKLYHAALVDIGGVHFESVSDSSDKLSTKIEKCYQDAISIDKGNAKRGNIIYSKAKDPNVPIRKEVLDAQKVHHKVRDVALLLRRAILEAPKSSLPVNVKLEDICQGEVNIPPILQQFFTFLISGLDKRRQDVPSRNRRINAVCADVIYAATSGNTKPAKHMKLGLAMKSLTGSRKVIDVLNRFGYTVSYNVVEELETEMTLEANNKAQLTPFGMGLDANLGTGVAFDNYDEFVETLSGKDTLHDTVGIAYQVIPKKNELVESEEIQCLSQSSKSENSCHDVHFETIACHSKSNTTSQIHLVPNGCK